MKSYVEVIITVFVIVSTLLCAAPGSPEESMPAEGQAGFDRIQVPFIINKGEIPDKNIAYFAKLFEGYVHVDKNGMIIHNFSSPAKNGIVISELTTEKPASLVPLEPPPELAVEAFKQKGYLDQVVGNYYRLSYGMIRAGIELQLLAFADGLEKLFIISPGADPDTISVTIRGVGGIKVNDAGSLEVQTKGGEVTFKRTRAYQLAGEAIKPVEVAYVVRKGTVYGFKVRAYDKSKPLIIGPFLPPALVEGMPTR